MNLFFTLPAIRSFWVTWTEAGWCTLTVGQEITVCKGPESRTHFYLEKHWDPCLRIHAVLNWNHLRICPVFSLVCVPVNFTFQMLINCSLVVLLLSSGDKVPWCERLYAERSLVCSCSGNKYQLATLEIHIWTCLAWHSLNIPFNKEKIRKKEIKQNKPKQNQTPSTLQKIRFRNVADI